MGRKKQFKTQTATQRPLRNLSFTAAELERKQKSAVKTIPNFIKQFVQRLAKDLFEGQILVEIEVIRQDGQWTVSTPQADWTESEIRRQLKKKHLTYPSED